MSMSAPMPVKIDFVSDVACPWCAIGLHALEHALQRLNGELQVQLRFHPFELSPEMPPQGQDLIEYLSGKYGVSPQQMSATHERLRERGAALGFEFGPRTRVWNTFDAHRLLHWAGLEGRQRELKHALLRAYHSRGENPGARDVLLRAAAEAGLDAAAAGDVIDTGRFADEVRAAERLVHEMGIDAVPSVIVNGQYVIQGGQPPEVFEHALREVTARQGG